MVRSPLAAVTTTVMVVAVSACRASSFDAEPLVTVSSSTVMAEVLSAAVAVTFTPVASIGTVPAYSNRSMSWAEGSFW